MTKIRLAILALFIISWQFIAAQVYPVQVTTQLSAPYSLYLPDYVSPGSERLVVTAFLGDISRPELNVRFKLRIEGQGVILETKPDYIPAPLSLQGGVPLRMISSDLAPYFEPRNLNFLQGLTQREFEQQGGKLPEGLYSFCFEVLEYNRGVKISNSGCANAWMILNDPPIINIPRQDEKLKPLNPQNFVIQWTPRHTGSPNSAFNTEYEVSMVEVWPSTRNPNDAILTSPPIFETTTESTTVIYGPAETPLEPGRRYAFRIRAKSKVGIDELDLFKNHGYSEVYTFTYGDACALPEEISAEAFTSRFNLTWDGKFNHTAFNVRYRKAGTTDWYVNKSTFNEVAITSLRPSTVYEYQVSGACGWYESDYTTVATIKTKDEPERTYSCGLPMETFNLDPSKLTGSLKVGDVIDAGDFDVELTKVTGGAGVFSGEAIVVMPMMNKIKVKAEFSNITVAGVPTATDYRMVKGFMNVTGGGIDVIPAGIVNAMDKLVETLDVIDSALHIVEEYIPKKGPDPVSFAADTLVNVDGNILAVVRDPNSGKVIVTTTNGKTTTLPPGKNYALTDKDGKGYVVDSNGAVTKTTADVATKASQRKYNFAVQFSNVTTLTSPGGFDPYTGNNILSSTYESLNKTYFVPWKASAQNGTGSLTAVLTDRSLDASKVRFEMIDVQGTSTLVGDRWTFNITAATAGKIVAYYPASGPGDKEQILGKVNIQGFDPKPYKLVIVKDADGKYPFTNNDVKVLTDSLNRIYGQALVSWQVSYEERDFNIDKSFDAGNSGLLSNYTADMRKVINAYGSLQNETYYLFVIDKPTNSGDVVGFMPRSQQAGFIYTTSGTTPASFIHTAAHELGHAVFNLKHIFDEFTGLGEKSTKNLMDYTDITSHQLMRFQWERIHDPVTVIGLFEEDEDAAFIAASSFVFDDSSPGVLEGISGSLTDCGNAMFVTKFKKLIILSADDKAKMKDYGVQFSGGLLVALIDKEGKVYTPMLQPVLAGIPGAPGGISEQIISRNDPIQYVCRKCIEDDIAKSGTQIKSKIVKDGNDQSTIYSNVPATYIFSFSAQSCVPGDKVYASYEAGRVTCMELTEGLCVSLETGGVNGSQGSGTKGPVIVDYSQGKDGVSLLSLQQRQNIEQGAANLNTQLEVTGKIYVLNTENPRYEELLAEAKNDNSTSKTIVTLGKGENGGSVYGGLLDYGFVAPKWFTDMFPSNGPTCAGDEIKKAITKLHESAFYKAAPIDQKIIAEYSTLLYKGIFATFYCATSEESVKNASSTVKFTAGALHELIASVDVVDMVGGIVDLAKGIASAKLESYTTYIADIRQIMVDYKNGTAMGYDVLAQRLMPPDVRFAVTGIKTGIKVADGFVKFYFTDCKEMCPYRYGQITVMVLPIVLTAGEWAAIKFIKQAELANNLKNAATVGANVGKKLDKAEDVATVLTEAEKNGLKTVHNEAHETIEIVETTIDDAGEVVDEVIADVIKEDGNVIIQNAEEVAKTPSQRAQDKAAKIARIKALCDPCAKLYKANGSLRGKIKNLQESKDLLKIEFEASGKSWTDFITDYEAHHVIPKELLENSEGLQFYYNNFKGEPLKFNELDNGIMVEKFKKDTGLGAHGSHDTYSDAIGDYIQSKFEGHKGKQLNNEQIANLMHIEVKSMIEKLKKAIKENCIDKPGETKTKINDLDVAEILE